ncbi:MAG: penicillin acylase family protein, partial [Bryobacteraceae bacterium]
MRSARLLRFLNLSIAALLVAFLVVAWWYGWRPLPETSGTIKAPVSAEARIVRDALGVPHIEAATIEDAIFLQGFATAEDRMWQMDALRRLAGGELAEVIGKRALEADEEARRLRMQRMAELHERSLPPEDRKIMAAYARGVNYYLETHHDRLPLEFALLNYDPRPWTIKDSLLAALQMHRNLTTSWKEDWAKRGLLLAAKTPEDKAKVDLLYPPRAGWEPQPGSNAWAIGGARTASGKPILANDPHLEFSAPSTWHMVHLKAPGLNVIGVALPGIPAVVIGHNEKIAWGVTNLHFDVQDLYEERFEQSTGRYQFQGRIEQASVERETIGVKGDKPVTVPVFVTRHGPVIVTEGPKVFTLRWAAGEAGTFQFPFLDLNSASNWEEFRAALRRFPGPGQNFVYADTSGNIGYQATGLLPIRQGFNGSVPLDGASGTQEWKGFIPFDSLPSTYNPAAGRIVTANQNPFPPDYGYEVGGNFAAPYRAKQIGALLDAKPKGWTPEGMLSIQKDVYSGFLLFLAQQAISAAARTDSKNSSVLAAVDVLKKWHGQMEKDL